LETISKAEEFNVVHLRQGEKSFYNQVVNPNHAIRYSFKPGAKGTQVVEETWQKVSLLIQVELSYPKLLRSV
jgi:predicted amidohydrolase